MSVDLIFLSEPNIFQYDLSTAVRQVDDKFCCFLNSDDLYDTDLAMLRNRTVGGTLVMWANHLDPHVTIHPTTTSSVTALVLQLPGYQVTSHVAIYLPTSGKDHDFISELTNLRICLAELSEMFPRSIIYV